MSHVAGDRRPMFHLSCENKTVGAGGETAAENAESRELLQSLPLAHSVIELGYECIG